jgi:hypothetical protein
MGFYSEYHNAHPNDDKKVVNIEWVLKELDKITAASTTTITNLNTKIDAVSSRLAVYESRFNCIDKINALKLC